MIIIFLLIYLVPAAILTYVTLNSLNETKAALEAQGHDFFTALALVAIITFIPVLNLIFLLLVMYMKRKNEQ